MLLQDDGGDRTPAAIAIARRADDTRMIEGDCAHPPTRNRRGALRVDRSCGVPVMMTPSFRDAGGVDRGEKRRERFLPDIGGR